MYIAWLQFGTENYGKEQQSSKITHLFDGERVFSSGELRLRGFSQPALLTLGDQSPPTFAPVVAKLAEALPRVEVVTFPGSGHIPHATHPDAYVEAIMAFTRKHAA